MNQGAYCLGVDPAKRKFTACLLDPEGRELFCADLEASRTGFDALGQMLCAAVPPRATLLAGVEASCALDDNLLALLCARPATSVLRLDAAQVKAFHGPRPVRGKEDRADARRIALFTRTYGAQLDAFEHDRACQAMADLVNERLELVEDLTRAKNRLRDRLITTFPEFESFFSQPWGDLALALLERAPTAAHAARMRPATLAAIRHKAPHARCLGPERAGALHRAAATSIASATDEAAAQAVLRLVARLRLLLGELAQIDERLAQHTSGESAAAAQVRAAATIPGIATTTAATIVLRSRGLARFHSAKAFAAQLAACPDRHQTGHSTDRAALTHRGDRRCRPMLFIAAMNAARADPAMAFHAWRHQQAGKSRKQALGALMNRLARLMWTLATRATTYDPAKAIDSARTHHKELWNQFLQQHPALAAKAEIATQETQQEALTC